MVDGNAIAARAKAALDEGITYQEKDCKRFCEYIVRECGGNLSSPGSNDMARNQVSWLLALFAAKSQGILKPGCVLFIHAFDGKEPQKYKADGKGNFSHIGFYIGEPDCEVIHSSSSKGKVCVSTLRNGWTHAGCFKVVECGSSSLVVSEPAIITSAVAYVKTPDGNPLKQRNKPSSSCSLYWKIPNGAVVEVLEAGTEWTKVAYNGKEGYCKTEFIQGD